MSSRTASLRSALALSCVLGNTRHGRGFCCLWPNLAVDTRHRLHICTPALLYVGLLVCRLYLQVVQTSHESSYACPIDPVANLQGLQNRWLSARGVRRAPGLPASVNMFPFVAIRRSTRFVLLEATHLLMSSDDGKHGLNLMGDLGISCRFSLFHLNILKMYETASPS